MQSKNRKIKTVSKDLASLKTEINDYFAGQEKEYIERIESEFYKIVNLLFDDAKEKSVSYFNEMSNRSVSRTYEISNDKKEKFFTLITQFNNGEKILLFASSTQRPNGNYDFQLKLYPKGMIK